MLSFALTLARVCLYGLAVPLLKWTRRRLEVLFAARVICIRVLLSPKIQTQLFQFQFHFYFQIPIPIPVSKILFFQEKKEKEKEKEKKKNFHPLYPLLIRLHYRYAPESLSLLCN